MSSWWQFPWHPPPELEVLPRADDQLFQRSSLPSRGPLHGPNKGPLVAIHGYTPIYTQQNGNIIWEYNAWVCDVFFQNGDFKGKGLRMSRWVSDCGGQEEVLSASISGSFQIAISTAMFWRWGHGRWILLNCGTVAASIHFAAEIHGEIMEYPLSKYFMVFFQSYRNGSPQKYLESIPLH